MDTTFEGDAAFFDLVAEQTINPNDKAELHLVANACRALGRLDPAAGHSAAERWRFRAEECRTLADQFGNAECRKYLAGLATTYDHLAESTETTDYLNSLKSA